MAIVVKLQGGLGNQMFQYAFGRAFAHNHNCKLFFDYSFFDLKEAHEGFTPRLYELNVFKIEAPKANKFSKISFLKESILNKVLRKIGLPHKKIITEKYFKYDNSIEATIQPVYFNGYWQCEKYFDTIKEVIKQEFTFSSNLDFKSTIIADKIKTSNAVSVHVRRGDYISSTKNINYHGSCSVDYYLNAFEIIENKFEDARFFIFSDDPNWVKENLIQNFDNRTSINHNSGSSSWKDMYLMSLCKHNIIANSSFSWWGAWLNNNDNKTVIAPKKWFVTDDPAMDTTDIIPATWIRL